MQGSSLSKDVKLDKKLDGSLGVIKASGDYAKNENHTDTVNQRDAMEEQYDPYHSLILNLLNDLSLSESQTFPPKGTKGKLMLFHANISIKNLGTISKLCSIMKKHGKLFDIPTKIRSHISAIQDFLELMPLSTDIEVYFNDSFRLTGQLKESCLLLKYDDILRSYGVTLPGLWYVLGIVDHIEKTSNIPLRENANFLSSLDIFINAIKNFYNSSEYQISPILIYRVVEK